MRVIVPRVSDWNGWGMASEWKIPAYQKWYLMLNQKEDVELKDLDCDGWMVLRLI
jgi:hypothetical protein